MYGIPFSFGGMFGTIIILVLVVQAVLWFCLPFVVFSISSKLSEIARLMRRQRRG